MPNLDFDKYYDLWRKNIHINSHARNWNDSYWQLKYYKLQLKYPET